MLAIQRGAEAVEAEVDVCKALITAGKFAAARRRLEDDIQRDPQTMYAGPLIVLVLDHGQYKDAYRLAGWMFRAGVDDHTVRLGAALAAAEAGSIYPGQHEYVMDSVAGRYALPSMLKCLPTGHSRQEELFLAALALGEDTSRMGSEANAIPFLELAGRIDPNNPEVCRYLAVDYAATGFRYTLALATLRRALPRAEGYDRGVIECYEKTFQHNLATVGEGNPVPPDPRGSYLTSNPGALDLSTHKPHTSPRP